MRLFDVAVVGGGVAGGSFRNDIIIRGGAPNENVFYLDGIEIPVINHFQTQGSSGGPQGMFVIESAINKAADELRIPASQIQQKNLLKTGDEFPYGQKAESEANECWDKTVEKYEIEKLINEANKDRS